MKENYLSEKESSIEIVSCYLGIGSQINALLSRLDGRISEENFRNLRNSSGKILAQIYSEVLEDCFSRHPTIKPDGIE